MTKQLSSLIVIFLIAINSYSQVNYELGYFIDNNNKKIECLIKNFDWKENPTYIEYKPNENDSPNRVEIHEVLSFEIYGTYKFQREKTQIDLSSENINKLSKNRNPEYIEKTVFLNILVEGNASLFYYREGNLNRFFYNTNNGEIKPLIYKRFSPKNNELRENNQYKQQLSTNLNCKSIDVSKINDLEYNKKKLVQLFIDYNKCLDSEYVSFVQNKKRDLFNLTIRPRFNTSTLEIRNSNSIYETINFGNSSAFGIGLEAEFILPFNKNKWSVAIEPTYHKYEAVVTSPNENIYGGELISSVYYKSIELPLSLRHYLFINQDSKIFLNASLILDMDMGSSLVFSRNDNSIIRTLDISGDPSFALGMGYKLHDKFSLEIKYTMNREIVKSNHFDSDYRMLSFILGYSFF